MRRDLRHARRRDRRADHRLPRLSRPVLLARPHDRTTSLHLPGRDHRDTGGNHMSDLIATQDIPFGDPGRGVYAYRKGDRVSAEAVKEHGWQEYVSGPSSKSAKDALAEASG